MFLPERRTPEPQELPLERGPQCPVCFSGELKGERWGKSKSLSSSSQGPLPLAGRRFQLPGEGSGRMGEQVGRGTYSCSATCAPVILRPLGTRDSMWGPYCWL